MDVFSFIAILLQAFHSIKYRCSQDELGFVRLCDLNLLE